MTMKKQYQTPDIDLIRFSDVITTSGNEIEATETSEDGNMPNVNPW